MKEVSFELKTDRYPISCKSYSPGTEVKGVVLGVHGFGGDKESSALRKLAYYCDDKGVALICFDFPAHGTSGASERELTVENCVSDLLAVADWCRGAYPDAKKYLFATSFGGYIALSCERRLSDFSIALRAPAVTMAEHILTDLLKTTPEEFRRRGSIACGFERRIDLPYAFYQGLQKHRICDPACDRPILVIQGDKDEIVPIEDIRAFCKSRRNAILRIINGADHRFKNPGEIERVIEEAASFWGI